MTLVFRSGHELWATDRSRCNLVCAISNIPTSVSCAKCWLIFTSYGAACRVLGSCCTVSIQMCWTGASQSVVVVGELLGIKLSRTGPRQLAFTICD